MIASCLWVKDVKARVGRYNKVPVRVEISQSKVFVVR